MCIVLYSDGETTTFSYDPAGNIILKQLNNGTLATMIYDAARQITRVANLKSNLSIISQMDYEYDPRGNRVLMQQADGVRFTWSYDAISQLLAEEQSTSSPSIETYVYDPSGNRTVKSTNGLPTTYSYDAANQLMTSVATAGITTYLFDVDGNQQFVLNPDGTRTTMVWDYENHLTGTHLPTGRVTYAYDPQGLRISKKS